MEPTQEPQPQSSDWRELIPEPLRQEKVWESVPDVPTLMKNYVDMSKYTVGAVRIPAADASAEDKAKFYAKLGRPESADDYAIPEAPEGVTLNTERLAALRQAAHAQGLSVQQFNALATTWLDQDSQQIRALQHEAQTVTESLKQDWGGAFERKLSLAQRTMSTVFGEEVAQQIAGSALGNNPQLIKSLAKLGEQMAEDGLIPAQTGSGMTKEEAKAEASALMAKPEYLNSRHPAHAATAQRVTQLFEFLYN